MKVSVPGQVWRDPGRSSFPTVGGLERAVPVSVGVVVVSNFQIFDANPAYQEVPVGAGIRMTQSPNFQPFQWSIVGVGHRLSRGRNSRVAEAEVVLQRSWCDEEAPCPNSRGCCCDRPEGKIPRSAKEAVGCWWEG